MGGVWWVWWAATGMGHSPEGWGSGPLQPLPWTEAEDGQPTGLPCKQHPPALSGRHKAGRGLHWPLRLALSGELVIW